MVRAVGLYPIGRGFNPHPAYHFLGRVAMSFETKKKIELAAIIIGSIVLFSMPIFVMMAA